MIADLKPYPEYKESGLPWLGQVPGHWQMRPAFGAFVTNREHNHGMKEKTVLSLSYGRIVIKPAEKLHGLVPESFETYQVVNPGDIVLRTTDLQNDHTSLRVGMVQDRGIITSAYLALRTSHGVTPKFGFQFLNVWDSSKAIYGYGSGLRQNLDFSHFKRMPVAVPPLDEQAAIVQFLDWANGRLERAIRAKRKVIALLNEQKQVIIHRAVTRGLDPSVPLKPSGISWLGDIPQHWEVHRITRVARLESGHTPSKSHQEYWREDNDIPWVSLRDTKQLSRSDYITDTHSCINRLGLEHSSARLLPAGVVVFTRDASVGKAAITTRPMAVSQHLIAWVCRSKISNEFLLRVFYAMKPELDRIGFGATIATIGMDDVRKLTTPLPPMAEQSKVVSYIREATNSLDTATSRLEREIELLREYRTRLVADVVTGKLDVREAAARLPDEAPLDTVEHDADLGDVPEAADEEAAA